LVVQTAAKHAPLHDTKPHNHSFTLDTLISYHTSASQITLTLKHAILNSAAIAASRAKSMLAHHPDTAAHAAVNVTNSTVTACRQLLVLLLRLLHLIMACKLQVKNHTGGAAVIVGLAAAHAAARLMYPRAPI
jgi:hypothetical protein